MDFEDLEAEERAKQAEGGEGGGDEEAGGAGPAESKGFDPYGMLGVPPDATDAAIKSAFRKASLKVHPDRCPGDPSAARRFRELAAAKDFLLNPFQRRLYNVRHGHLRQSASAIWWSDWETVFGEIEPEQDAELEGASPERPLATEDVLADLLIVGATGLTGTLACMLLQRGLWSRSWAIAGRDVRKLEMLQQKFGGGPLFRGTFRVETAEDVERAVRSARVVVDLTGPSHLVGSGVAEACVRQRRHYVDNTGDVKFSRAVRDRLHDGAEGAGVCLVLHTGYCSLPPDFGTWYMVRHMREKYGVATRRVDAYDRTTGFVLSGTNYVQGQTFGGEQTKDWDMFLLGGARKGGPKPEDQDPNKPVYDENTGMWSLQAAISDRIVIRASCGLLDASRPYGPSFRFGNWVPFPSEESCGEAMMMTRFVNPKTLGRLAQQQKIPPVGSGPGERMRQECYVTRVFVAVADERRAKPRVAHGVMHAGPGGFGDRYEGTAAMSVEAACALLDAEDGGNAGALRPGWGTPVYHLAHLGFWERLVARGASFKVIEGLPPHQFFENVIAGTMPIEA